MWLHFWFCIHFWFLGTELIIALWNVGRLFLLYYHTFLICASMLDNSPESRNLLAASSNVLMLLEDTVVLWNFVEDTTLLPDWSCSFDTSEKKFLKTWKFMHINWLYIAVYSICGYENKPNLSHKNIYCFFFVYKSNYSWSTLLHLKIIQLSKFLQMIWTRKYFHIKIKCLLSVFWQILTT